MAHITLDRKIFDHFFWTERRPKTKFEAWIDLIQLVSFADKNEQLINNVLVKWGRAQYPVSISFLSKRWFWSSGMVRRYLTLLKSTGQATIKTTGKATILTICNYDKYNPRRQDDRQGNRQGNRQANDKVTDKQTAGIKEDKEDKYIYKEEAETKVSAPVKDFIGLIIDEFSKAYKEEFGLEYIVVTPGKEKAAAGKLAKVYKEKYPKHNTEQSLAGLRDYFDSVVKVPDDWFRNNMSLSTLMSKFNEINNTIKNGNNKRTKTNGANRIELAGLMATKTGARQTGE